MIIFDLDGTLANCEHRRHFVDPVKSGYSQLYNTPQCFYSKKWVKFIDNESLAREFKPDWDAFHEACDKDEPNHAIMEIYTMLRSYGKKSVIWSGRSESVREKTIKWLTSVERPHPFDHILKMRPIGDTTPDDVLKERWLDEALAEGKNIDMVFDDRDKVVKMWRRRGITCLQVAEGDF